MTGFKTHFGSHAYRSCCGMNVKLREIQYDALGFDLSNWVGDGVIL